MKLLIALAVLASTSSAFAGIIPVKCDVGEKVTTKTVNVYDGDQVALVISGVNPSTGFNIVSAEHLEGKFWKSTSFVNPGAPGKTTFVIKADDQDQATATYTFEYKRAWEKNVPAVSTCLVTIKKN